MALATLDRTSGVKERKIFQLVGDALPNATENGFSQAVWLCDNSSRDFIQRFPQAEPSSEAYEAKLQIAFEQRDFDTAIGFSQLWLEDQPFNVDAIVHFLNMSFVHSSPTEEASRAAKRYAQMFFDNWQVLNACFLVLVQKGDLTTADRVLARMDKIVPSGSNRAFVEAARGFYSFASGDFIRAREFYELAIKLSSRAKRPDLIINSTIFWLRCEVANGLLSESYANEIGTLIGKAIKKMDIIHRSYLLGVWYSAEKAIAACQKDVSAEAGQDFHRIASQALDQPDLFAIAIA